MPADRCVCGCGRRGRHDHHVIYRQELRRRAAEIERARAAELAASGEKEWVKGGPPFSRPVTAKVIAGRLGGDRRNIVRIAFECHSAHHSRARPLDLGLLPDSAFEFALELLGGPAAFEYFRRYYAGGDRRHDALLHMVA